MADANPLTELAERVQRLTGACRETDYLICEAVHPFLAEYGPASENTASLDAAMTLTEPGAEISISTLYGVARVEYTLNFADHEPYRGEHVGGLIAPAICAAVLLAIDGKIRARAASENSHG